MPLKWIIWFLFWYKTLSWQFSKIVHKQHCWRGLRSTFLCDYFGIQGIAVILRSISMPSYFWCTRSSKTFSCRITLCSPAEITGVLWRLRTYAHAEFGAVCDSWHHWIANNIGPHMNLESVYLFFCFFLRFLVDMDEYQLHKQIISIMLLNSCRNTSIFLFQYLV